MVGESRVPPDAGVNIFGNFLASLVCAGFVGRAVLVNEIGTRNHHLRSFAFAGMHVDLRLLGGTALLGRALVENIDDVIVRLVELSLREIGKQAVVAAVSVDDQNFLAAVAGHLVGGFLQQCELQAAAVGHGSRFVTRFGDLAEIIFGEDNSIFLLGGMQRGVADIQQVGAER